MEPSRAFITAETWVQTLAFTVHGHVMRGKVLHLPEPLLLWLCNRGDAQGGSGD